MATSTAKPCIRCRRAPRVTEYHCARCAAYVEREQAKLDRLMHYCEGNQGERIELADEPYTAVVEIARRCGWKPESKDFRVWVRA